MNAVARQRLINARRIAEAEVGAAPEAAVVEPLPDRSAPRPLAVTAQDRADAVSGSPVAIDLLAPSAGSRAVVALAGPPAHGRVVLGDDSTAVYTSAPGYTGTDVFGYRLVDACGRVFRVTVTVSVAPQAEPASGRAVLAYAA
ncbi:Ig-like domain-containing protein [Streptacidiphilus sp. P02-A3a]|uniref:Ig-like domain-containing protein n=1 Tax=Streptacidiphilus sp. P02-A3a TaxID=2704468 RepID=UPI0015FBCCF3|nr:Ig-like domain-containing protein [Streptacidiphilus sp. P02-A3a]QMU68488.1 hypothetical protein GXP74_09840 [Streptacidiphilus sp. P02-A3a]